MSRNLRWTEEDVLRLQNRNGGDLPSKPEKSRETTVKQKNLGASEDYVGRISSALAQIGIRHRREYKFLHDRRFRFDIAIPDKMIAVEFEGGIWRAGRHVRGRGYARDAKKYNLATMHGWRLLRYTTEDCKSDLWEYEIAGEIKRLINKKK